jgi:hypothetical protein
MRGQRRHRALAVGPGHREHRRAVVPGEELDVAEHGNPARQRRAHDRAVERQAGTDAQQVDALQERLGERSGVKLARERGAPRRVGAGVGNAHRRAFARREARHRKAGVAEAEHEQALAAQGRRRGDGQQREERLAHHLSFSVDRPNSTSIMVMIQKRTTTWLSFQPSSS